MTTVYMILADFGRHGTAWVERDPNHTDLETTIADIASGEWDKVVKVVAFDVEEGWARDVTADVLAEVEKRGGVASGSIYSNMIAAE